MNNLAMCLAGIVVLYGYTYCRLGDHGEWSDLRWFDWVVIGASFVMIGAGLYLNELDLSTR